ncbi:MAG: DUF721 domain-containing protein [Acidobacteriaceae bacterium]
MDRMRDVLRTSIATSLRTMSPEDRLAAAWPVVCGQAIAERTQVLGLHGGKLQIGVADAAWQQQMQSMGERLKHELTRIAGVPLTDILFLVGSAAQSRPTESQK